MNDFAVTCNHRDRAGDPTFVDMALRHTGKVLQPRGRKAHVLRFSFD